MGLNIKKGDQVVVLAGKSKGVTGKVLTSIPGKNAVIVEGANIVTKHQKPRRPSTNRAMPQTQTGLVKMPAAMPVGKVMLVCPQCQKPTRVGHGTAEGGRSSRVCKKCGELIDVT